MASIYRLFTNCKLVKGYTRSIIIDIQRDGYYFIPNECLNYFNEGNLIIAEKSDVDFMNFLIDQEMIFPVNNDIELSFPDTLNYWDYPAKISNAIIEVTEI